MAVEEAFVTREAAAFRATRNGVDLAQPAPFVEPVVTDETDAWTKQNEAKETSWLNGAVIYHVYVNTFSDPEGTGHGTLKGVTEKIPYIHWLGADALLFSPFYPSGGVDGGYDVLTHRGINPNHGILEGAQHMRQVAESYGLKKIYDHVGNHRSSQTEEFQEALSDPQSPYRAHFIFAQARADGGPPTEMLGFFGYPVWTPTPDGGYYYAQFCPWMPDLNVRNPVVRKERYNDFRFLIEALGADGIRMDVLSQMMNDPFTQPPLREGWDPTRHALIDQYEWETVIYRNRATYRLVAQDRRFLDQYGVVGIGEINTKDPRHIRSMIGKQLDRLHMPMNFRLAEIPRWDAKELKKDVQTYLAALPEGAIPNYISGTHDNRRFATRVGIENQRVAMMFLMTIGGTVILYNFDEIGRQSGGIPNGQATDVQARSESTVYNRDNSRLPGPWHGSNFGGFTKLNPIDHPDAFENYKPPLPIDPDVYKRNVARQMEDPTSELHVTRNLIKQRKEHRALTTREVGFIDTDAENVLVYEKVQGNDRYLVALNFSNGERHMAVQRYGTVVLSTDYERDDLTVSGQLSLKPHEGVIIELKEEKRFQAAVVYNGSIEMHVRPHTALLTNHNQ